MSLSGDEPARRVVVLMRTVRERRECQVGRKDDISRMTGLVQEDRDPPVTPRTTKHLELEQKVKRRGLSATRDQNHR